MIIRTLTTIVAVLFLCTGARAEEEEQPSAVDLLLEQVSRDLKKLSRTFDNPASRETSLKLADSLIDATAKAKALEPESAQRHSGAEREKYMALYHQGMEELLLKFETLKKALEADEPGPAEAAMEEARALREKYHLELDVR